MTDDARRTWTCPACQNSGWLCEDHPAEPMDHSNCSGAGMPCECNHQGDQP